jgi:3'-phosphoadenosine 5'-phosphosulfate (PAPS) 3'-phosphatase
MWTCLGVLFHTAAHVVPISSTPHYLRPLRPRGCLRCSTAQQQEPISSILEQCKLACDSISDLVEEVYSLIGSAGSAGAAATAFKGDESYFTLADGLVQALLLRLLIDRVGDVVGEEDGTECRISAAPFTVGDMVAPAELESTILRCRDTVDELCSGMGEAVWPSITAFVDPIDGTREFCTGKGTSCSICVGLSDSDGRVVGGLVYRPLDEPRSWAMGCAAEGFVRSSLRVEGQQPEVRAGGGQRPGGGSFLMSPSGGSPFLEHVASELGLDCLRVGGAGNKALLLLEGVGACYIQVSSE